MNRDDLRSALESPNVKAFLRVIRAGESSQDESAYTIMFGGEHFDSFADHPRRTIQKNGYTSTAAGAYQFLARTWDGLVAQYGFPDFSPECQDEGAVALIAGRRALEDVLAGRIEDAIAKCGKEWASLPGSPYGQPTRTLEQALATFAQYGGATAPIEDRGTDWHPEEKPVAPLLAALIPSIVQAIPNLAKVFAGDNPSEVANRNVKAAETVAAVVTQATQAVNLQDAVEKMQRDPAALQAARQAVEDSWFTIVGEAGSGGLEGARKADAAMVANGHFWLSPTFWIAVSLIPLVYMIIVGLMYPSIGGEWNSETRAALIGGVLGTITGAITQYYMGSTTARNRPGQ